ncbi:putative mitochondrial acyl-CoA dehydrogenase [Leptomonas pyrrhocoris]|uniref:Putative mitochondrial acyl-CoA dehydrogenase n=1 Tax=Leptomonas pyrrhocoris TaxID=157538 RepID=A0A0N0DZD1_LEPPY|nr:putative mitochondrial acyl-CoA dehydrogenase [Leptomonas pyrrhocoris]XP_015663591.1 putative mitochondrial acyl-CoA dehydrogenase [Leptomonas pyrrhocoris]XP_015663592.1 putative mitochondrial acyl-CoA dehydrogenase [Leptomonas pyrrhocoris]KPA85151.1 putative mitochondrial acyl-CoA dehydrogenase [Leptomonas pyrrhocoris]KPA85152.1 putative mitochondrial acyl-CoA dehydrogenase [Leptomonas pyrrhocoris]KPA85153.1 putative mitochondrial acyl-CoA dehydrogenase [Leptomonas pyrrhocoris]|eukprot:XP_015663590.1 putative mitochondrial acyl-CoA dehydrogenase [Leptomonas pyrrhocoris]
MLRRLCAAAGPQMSARAKVAIAARSLTYTPRTRDVQFLYEEVFHMYDHYGKLAGKDGASRENTVTKELMDALLEESSKLSTQTLFPLYEPSDTEGCKLANGVVTTPKGFKEAYKAYAEGGWVGINDPEKYGGQGLPVSVGFTTREIMSTANWSFGMYPNLSQGACQTLLKWASDELKEVYLPKLVSGEWSGTMCLTEPQCGTDLGQVKTKAEPLGDGKSYHITGTKIFISAGDHDLVDNIAHVVLARLPNSKPSTKGLSLFLVPRHVVKPDGTLEAKKNVECIGVEKKMGIKGSATSQLSFDNSVGYLIGSESEGMKEMFTYMNAARMGCGMQGVSHAELAFQNSLRYARERRSMRALSGTKEPEKPADTIICHANVRSNILFSKAVAEGGRALIVDVSRMLDLHFAAPTPEAAAKLDNEIGFYTPIAKGCLTEWGFEAASRSLQVWGGHGYINGNGMEQILRDSRIGTLYEGTTGVQAMDFIGRKVLSSKGGNQAKRFGQRVNKLARAHLFSSGPLGSYGRHLWLMQKQWRIATMKIGFMAQKNHDAVAAASEDFLMYSGYLTLGYYWLRMAEAAQKKVAAGQDPDGFYQAKLDTCEYVFTRVLPRADAHYKMMQEPPALCAYKQENWDIQ